MPQTFNSYLRQYPEVFRWYENLSFQQAIEFEADTLQHFNAGRSVVVPVVPLHLNNDFCASIGNDNCFILTPPVDGIIQEDPFLYVPAATLVNRDYRVFVPYHSFKQCAECLETVDLRAAQIRAVRILRYLNNADPPHDFFAELWRNYRQALVRYGIYIAEEYVERGGSDKVLEYLKPFIRRREWTKPSWVYVEGEWKRHRSHLLWRGLRRVVAYEIRQVNPSVRDFLRRYGCTTLQHCDEHLLCSLRHEIDRADSRRIRSRPVNFYSLYNWDLAPCKG